MKAGGGRKKYKVYIEGSIGAQKMQLIEGKYFNSALQSGAG